MEIRRKLIDLDERAVTLNKEGNFGEAVKVLEQAKQMAEENLDTKDEMRLGAIRYLGETYISNGEYMKGQALLEDILSVQRQETPNVLLATILCALGRCYHYQNKSMDATRLLAESLSIYQKYVSANDARVTSNMKPKLSISMMTKYCPDGDQSESSPPRGRLGDAGGGQVSDGGVLTDAAAR
ncbi:uncharacterized protein LOC134177715 [Corticium candelabrum]|uniref:uncharacterized protein LOC134177715 n=1 Tax=Corticium candelabrum TaxID=121492 RepID=UPI002E26065B|nr:uncharacterized protein LOC134177715 [Corticium candelabrum]